MDHLLSFILETSREYRDVLWAVGIALVIFYYKNKKMCEEAQGKTCKSHTDMKRDVASIGLHFINSHNSQKWIIRHIYKLCAKAGIEVEKEPTEVNKKQ